MVAREDTIFERFLAPVVQLFVDQEALQKFYDSVDWQTEGDRWRNPTLSYPDYYSSQNFHGIKGGYLNPSAAATYDPITQYALPPNETWVRQGVIEAIRGYPRRILDLGCGTGSTTVMLKQSFPQAEVIGLDLSPYMLVVADQKARQQGLEIQWVHGNAEQTDFEDTSFDLVTTSLLLHETPPTAAAAILQESFRLLRASGEVIILDGHQRTLRQANWLTQIFEEPYIQAYVTESVDAWLSLAGFAAVETWDHWWLNQVSRGVKPLPATTPERVRFTEESDEQPIGFDLPALA